MFALALGVGIALGVIFLPFADLGNYGWRISFLVSAGALFFLPVRRATAARNAALHDARRAVRAARPAPRGVRVHVSRPIPAARSGGVRHERLHRTVVAAHQPLPDPRPRLLEFRRGGLPHGDRGACPGLIGVLLAGRLAESRGRRPVAIVGLLVATAFQMVFFVANDDALLWVAPTIAIVAAACAGLALGTLDAELFPTETRGTSNGFLLVAGVAGSATGLLRRDAAPRRDGWTRPRDRGVRDPDADRGGAPRSPTPRDGDAEPRRCEPDRAAERDRRLAAGAAAVRGEIRPERPERLAVLLSVLAERSDRAANVVGVADLAVDVADRVQRRLQRSSARSSPPCGTRRRCR